MCSTIERRAHERGGRLDVSHHERRSEPKHAVARASQHRIAAGVSAILLSVIPAIDLNHEPLSRRQEISDEATEQRHLAAEDHAEPAAANANPEPRFWRCE